MKQLLPTSILCSAVVLGALGFCQQPTLARLNDETVPDITHAASVPQPGLSQAPEPRTAMLPDSAFSRLAARSLFVNSDLKRAGAQAKLALRHNGRDAEALFVRMEVAGMEADEAAMLDAAVRLCEVGDAASDDPRVQLAAVRVRESAANTPAFRNVLPRVQALLAQSSQHWPELEHAVLNAAMDGVPRLDAYAAARAAGILTDWRIIGPIGRHPLHDFDQDPAANGDSLAQASCKGRPVENYQFPDGRIVLPDYLPQRGTFYASTEFAALTEGKWTIKAEGGGLELYVDGRRVLQTTSQAGGPTRDSATLDIAAGPHRVLLKFAPSAIPLRISVGRTMTLSHSALPANMSFTEGAYQLAARQYAAREFGTAIRQIEAASSSSRSAPLQFLLAQALQRRTPTTSDTATAWEHLLKLAPEALAADEVLATIALMEGDPARALTMAKRILATRPSDPAALETLTAALPSGTESNWTIAEESEMWTRRLAAHPTCEALQGAIGFYRSQDWSAAGSAMQQKLENCAPESLDYAQSLAQQGNHLQSAKALQRFLAAAPLNRPARQMLVRELQLAGEDAAAQHAAAEWLRIAPNAENFHRLAAGDTHGLTGASEFYQPYRRDAMAAARGSAARQFAADAVALLDDHVAIVRQDGSVSLYVHTATLVIKRDGIGQFGDVSAPRGAQELQLRIIHGDGTAEPIARVPRKAPDLLNPGDVVDQEYVVNYAGDGGIPEHAEAFQFIFGTFDQPVLSARFVVLTSAEQADRGVVIVTGEAPPMTTLLQSGVVARLWQKDAALQPNQDALAAWGKSPAIVRIVEQDNGWSVPSNAEHHRKIETIHRGPRFEDSSFSGAVESKEFLSHSL